MPLSLLEAVRAVDKPIDHLETEVVPELQNKRLGLSETVYAQIRRYADARKRGQRLGVDEVAAIARLVGRRPDAEVVFRAAGRHLAAEAYAGISGSARTLMRALPAILSRPMVLRHANRVAERFLDGRVERLGDALILRVPAAITAAAAAAPAAAAFYEAALRELLQLLTAQEATVQLIRFAVPEEGPSEWRADWRAAGR